MASWPTVAAAPIASTPRSIDARSPAGQPCCHNHTADSAAIILLKDKIKDVLETLTDRERSVLEQRFGLVDGYPRTLEEVGRQFKVTRERIRQIEAKALRKMRHPTRLRQLEGYLEPRDI